MTTAILSIVTLLIGVAVGMWIYQTYIDGLWFKAYRRMSNNFRQTKSEIKELQKQNECIRGMYSRALADNRSLDEENESLRFQIEQYNIGRDEMKFTEQK